MPPRAEPEMDATIVIPARNEEASLGHCLEAVLTQRTARTFEVIVIDSGSEDRTAAIAAQYPVRLLQIRQDEFHHARTRNLAARSAQGEFLVYLSADAWPQNQEWLEHLLTPFQDPGVGAVYGRQIAKPDATPERRFFMEHRYGNVPTEFNGSARNYRKFQFSTVNGALRRSLWTQVPFPEDLNAYEDFSWATQIASHWQIRYQPAAAVYHSHNYSLAASFRQYFDNGVIHEARGILNRQETGGMRADGLRFLQEELRYLVRTGAASRIPYVVCYEVSRYVGLVIGRHHRRLPQAVKRRWSSHRLFG